MGRGDVFGVYPTFLSPPDPTYTKSQKKAELGKKKQETSELNSKPQTARQSSRPPVMLNFLPFLHFKTPLSRLPTLRNRSSSFLAIGKRNRDGQVKGKKQKEGKERQHSVPRKAGPWPYPHALWTVSLSALQKAVLGPQPQRPHLGQEQGW